MQAYIMKTTGLSGGSRSFSHRIVSFAIVLLIGICSGILFYRFIDQSKPAPAACDSGTFTTSDVAFLQQMWSQRSVVNEILQNHNVVLVGGGVEKTSPTTMMKPQLHLSHTLPRSRQCSAIEAEANADHFVNALLKMGDAFRFSACATSTWLTAIRDFDSLKSPSERPKRVLVDVGANKGYVIAQFLGLFAAELGHTPQTLQQYLLSIPHIVSIQQKGQEKWSCGSCMDCKEILPLPPVERVLDEDEAEAEAEGEEEEDTEKLAIQANLPQAKAMPVTAHDALRAIDIAPSSSPIPTAELRRRRAKHKRLLRPFTPLVHALEPIKITYDLLQGWKDTAAIPDDILITHNLAVSDIDGEVIMQMPSAFNANKPGEEGAHLLSVSSGDLSKLPTSSQSSKSDTEENIQQPKLRVQALRLDSFFEKHLGWGVAVTSSSSSSSSVGTVVDFLMLDMEGYDPLGIFSATKSLSTGRVRMLVFEYNADGFYVVKGRLKQIVDHLDDLGFTCYMDGIGFKSRLTGSCWHDKYDRHHLGNIVCVRRSEYDLLGLIEAHTR